MMTQEQFEHSTAREQLLKAGHTVRRDPGACGNPACCTGWEWVAPKPVGLGVAEARLELELLRCAISDERLKLADVKRQRTDALNAGDQRDEANWQATAAREALGAAQRVAAHATAEAEKAKAEKLEAWRFTRETMQFRDKYRAEVTTLEAERDTAMRELSAARADLGRTVASAQAEKTKPLDAWGPWAPSTMTLGGASGGASWQPINTRNMPTLTRVVDIDPVRSTLLNLGPMKPGDIIVWPQRPNSPDTRDAAYVRTNEGWVCLLTGTRYSVSALDAETPNWVRGKVRL